MLFNQIDQVLYLISISVVNLQMQPSSWSQQLKLASK